MNSLNYRILAALRLGDWTCAELARMLSSDVFTVHKVVRELQFNHAIAPLGFKKRKYRCPIIYRLTDSGHAWAKSLISI